MQLVLLVSCWGSLCTICCDFVGDGIYMRMLWQKREKEEYVLKDQCTWELECFFCQSLNLVLPAASYDWCWTMQTLIDIHSYWRYVLSAYMLFQACQAWLKWQPCFCWLSFLFAPYYIISVGVHRSFFSKMTGVFYVLPTSSDKEIVREGFLSN